MWSVGDGAPFMFTAERGGFFVGEGIRFDLTYETMPWHKVDTVVFDIGNVLVRYNPVELAAELFPGDEAKQRHMVQAVYLGPDWQDLDRGTIDFDRAAERLSARHGYPREDYLTALRSGFELKVPLEEGWRAVRRCKRAGKRLYLLSNYSSEGYARVHERMKDRFALFEGDCISAHYHQLKPEPEIYQTLIAKFAIEPQRTLFIDDSLANIEAANQMGIHGFHLHENGMLDRFFL